MFGGYAYGGGVYGYAISSGSSPSVCQLWSVETVQTASWSSETVQSASWSNESVTSTSWTNETVTGLC